MGTSIKRVLRPDMERAGSHRYIGWMEREEIYVNLVGSYDYLSAAYYISQDYEDAGKPILPGCKDMIDAYVPPLFLEKARLAGIPVPEYYISNGYFEPPVIVDPINPFTLKGRVIRSSSRLKGHARSLTRNLTYAICCQDLPPDSRLVYFHSILGWAAAPAYRQLSGIIWDIFRIPLAKVRIIRLKNGQHLLSDISPLPFEDLGPRELHFIREHVRWDN
jgi:hypothetical protein